jgi:hypothetical protein
MDLGRRCLQNDAARVQKRPEPETAAPPADHSAQDRTIRALVSLADDLSVEGGEEGFLRSSLEHLVESLGVAGGAMFLVQPGGSVAAAAEWRLPGAQRAAALDLAHAMLKDERPRIALGPEGGWMAGAPLATKRRRLGIVTLHDPAGRTAVPATDLLEAVGKQIGTGLENARRYAELRVSSARAEVLHRIAGSLTSGSDLKSVIPAFARQIAAYEPFDRLACGFLNDSGDYIEIAGSRTARPGAWARCCRWWGADRGRWSSTTVPSSSATCSTTTASWRTCGCWRRGSGRTWSCP